MSLPPLVASEKPEPEAREMAPAGLTEKIRAIFPGITMNSKERFVDVDSVVCLTEGYLELLACARNSREHESIVMVEAKPSHIHAALLLIGSQPGNPATRELANKEGTLWLDVPPRGQKVKAALLVPDERGKMVEQPICNFITTTREETELPDEGRLVENFPDTFLFVGSYTHQENETKIYQADMSGNVISISTFGDEVLCLSGHHGQENESLSWQIKPDTLPALGTKVILRLRPVFAADSE